MKDFMLVRDALTDKLMIIRKSMICTVEEEVKNNKPVRRITYVDDRPDDYTSDTLISIMEYLKE